MKNQLFYTHEDDHQIMLKKDDVEIQHWLASLNYYTEEIQSFLQLAKNLKLSPTTVQQLNEVNSKNAECVKELSRYEIARLNAWECDDMACDSFYLNNHEEHRKLVMDHIHDYRATKKAVLAQLITKSS